MVKQRKKQFQQKLFDSLSENFGKNPMEYWNILKSSKKTNTEEVEELPDILKQEKTPMNHFQNQGQPKKY